MSHEFVSQPVAGGYDLQEFTERVCLLPGLNRLDFAVAWVKRGGLLGLQPTLDDFRMRHGRVRGIVGIDLGGTSMQGLLLAKQLCDELFVFHDPRRTFHPKVYAASGTERARTLVGSNNLTFGGLTRNYEAAVLSDLDLQDGDDRAFFEAVCAFFDGLARESEICHAATDAFLGELLTNRRYPIFDEDRAPRPDAEPVEGAAGAAEPADDEDDELFGSAQRPMRRARRPPAPSGARTRGGRRGAPGTTATGAPPSGAPDPVVKRWFKVLDRADAQQLGANSSPSNTMTLVQGGHPIDRNTYFRSVFFGGESWATTTTRGGQPREVASIEAEMVVDGASLGIVELEIRHTPGYASSQGNRVTELGWRDFGAHLRANPLTGRYAILEKMQSGRYRIRFERAPTDPFLP